VEVRREGDVEMEDYSALTYSGAKIRLGLLGNGLDLGEGSSSTRCRATDRVVGATRQPVLIMLPACGAVPLKGSQRSV
jgi:hypothetical protein